MEAHNANLGANALASAFGGTGPSWGKNMASLYTWLFNLFIKSWFHK